MEKIIKKLEEYGFYSDRMICGSKSAYHDMKPNNFVIFNANIFVENFGKIWWGDLDLTKDQEKLKKVASETNSVLYVLYEMDGRFDNENTQEFKNNYAWNTETGLSEKMKKYFNDDLLLTIQL
ncbi:hypothetical protein M0Q97_03365 [Candidatus Dojkabacteria bacterium]|jgi:hypothetical protein|nr:hypothetical protein [Candidatus Dojkabacteria bacterium]